MGKKHDTFAAKVARVREQAGITSYRLAQLSGLSKQTLSQLEAGTSQPSWETVQRLALALGVSTEVFRDSGLRLEEAPIGQRGRPRKAKGASRA
jgi:transcriptional regulator with XRE-family HTH domain